RTLHPEHGVEVVVGGNRRGRRRGRRIAPRYARLGGCNGGAAGGEQGGEQDGGNVRAHAGNLCSWSGRASVAKRCCSSGARHCAPARQGAHSPSRARIEAKPTSARSALRAASATGSAPSRCSSAAGNSSKKRLGASRSLAPQRCASRL